MAGADICECEVIRTNIVKDYDYFESKVKIKSYTTEEAMRLLIKNSGFHQHVWNKLYKINCLRNIYFPKGKINEDEFWTYKIFGNAKKVSKIESDLYIYFQRNNSIMGKKYNIERLDCLEAKFERQNYINSRFPSLKDDALIDMIQSCIYSGQMIILNMEDNMKQVAMKQAEDYFNKSIIMLKKTSFSFKEKMWIKLLKSNFIITCKIRNFLRIGF